MNRTLLLGVAIFLAIIGIALMGGGEQSALAGHGCHGCHGAHGGHGCAGPVHGCCGVRHHRCGCHGGGAAPDAGPPAAGDDVPAPPAEGGAKETSYQRTPLAFRKVSFRR